MSQRGDWHLVEEALATGVDPELARAKADELALLREQEALLLANPILAYSPNSGQQALHAAVQAQVANRFLWKSGNRSGKTRGATNEAGAWAQGERLWLPQGHPLRATPFRPPVVVRIGSTPAELDQTIQHYVPAGLTADIIVRTHRNQQGVTNRWELSNGSLIVAYSYKQETIEWEGSSAHLWLFNEPPPYDKYIAAVRGLADFGGSAIIVMTHLAEPWIKHRIENKAKGGDPKYWFQQTTSHVNLGFGLSSQGLDNLIADVGGEGTLEYRVRVLGESIHAEGLVIPQFDPKVHVRHVEWSPKWGVYCALDPHPQKPWAGMVYGVTPQGQGCILREFWKRPPRDADFAVWVKGEFDRITSGLLVVKRFVDPIAKTPGLFSARNASFKDEIAAIGLPFLDGTKDRQNGIRNIQAAFAKRVALPNVDGLQPALLVDPDCKRTLEELDSWLWQDAEETDTEALMAKAREEYDDQMSNLYRILADGPVHVPREVYESESTYQPYY